MKFTLMLYEVYAERIHFVSVNSSKLFVYGAWCLLIFVMEKIK
jgi:hypothetical protein